MANLNFVYFEFANVASFSLSVLASYSAGVRACQPIQFPVGDLPHPHVPFSFLTLVIVCTHSLVKKNIMLKGRVSKNREGLQLVLANKDNIPFD